MKKLATLVFALLLAGSLSFAQAGGSTDTKSGGADKKADKGETKEHKGGKKGHKGGKKHKKGGGEGTTPTPK